MAEGREVAPAPEPRYLLRSEHPQVAVTWSTSILSDRPKPDALKLRKRVTAWPLEFTFKVRGSRLLLLGCCWGVSRGQLQAAVWTNRGGALRWCCVQMATWQTTGAARPEPTASLASPVLQADYHTATREFTYGMMCRVGPLQAAAARAQARAVWHPQTLPCGMSCC